MEQEWGYDPAAAFYPPVPQTHPVLTPGHPDMPSFMGAASRKRKWEAAVEAGFVAPLGGAQVHAQGGKRGKGGGGKPSQPAAPAKGGSKGAQKGGAPGGKGAGAGGQAAGGNPRAEAAEAAALAKQGVKWINLPAEAKLVAAGLPDLGPALFHNAGFQTLLSSGSHILADLGIESSESITMTDDPDWTVYPEIGEAIIAAGGEQASFCVAECPERAIWAVGAAQGWKKREQCTRLAMAVALAANAEDFEAVAKAQPEFARFCEAAGIETGLDLSAPPAPAPKAKKALDFEGKPAAAAWAAVNTRQGGAGKGASAGEASGSKDKAFWVTVPDEEGPLPAPLDTLPLQGFALPNEGSRQGLHRKADELLAAVCGDLVSEVTYIEDDMWEQFPTIGAQLKATMNSEKGITVAVCPSAGCWALGVSNKAKNRNPAAKVALAATIALQSADIGQEVDASEFPSFADLLEEARTARGY